jgi:hypothetical protein
MDSHKGVTYQRRGNDSANKSYQNIPKAITPPISYLSVDLSNWISNAKVLVSVSELIKVPSQKEKLLKSLMLLMREVLSNIKENLKSILKICLLCHIVWIGQRKRTLLSSYI